MEMDYLILQPKETMMISETAGLLQPEKVAETILTDAIVSLILIDLCNLSSDWLKAHHIQGF